MFKGSFPLQTPILKLLYLKHCGQCHCENLYSAIKNHLDRHPRLFLSLPFILKGQRNQQDTGSYPFCFRRHQLLSVIFCTVFLRAFPSLLNLTILGNLAWPPFSPHPKSFLHVPTPFSPIFPIQCSQFHGHYSFKRSPRTS